MAARIRISIQDDKAESAAADNQSLFIRAICRRFTEDTALFFARGLHVRGTPWRPQMSHQLRPVRLGARIRCQARSGLSAAQLPRSELLNCRPAPRLQWYGSRDHAIPCWA